MTDNRSSTGSAKLLPCPSCDCKPSATALFDWLSTETSLELSYQGWDEDACWQVHRVTGGRNDREWTLLAEGITPFAVLLKAKALLAGEPSPHPVSAAQQPVGCGEVPEGATHMRRPEYITAWLFDLQSTRPVWLIPNYQSRPLPSEKIGHYATAVAASLCLPPCLRHNQTARRDDAGLTNCCRVL